MKNARIVGLALARRLELRVWRDGQTLGVRVILDELR